MATQEVAAADLSPTVRPKVLYWAPGLPYGAAAFALRHAGGSAVAVRDFWEKNGPAEAGTLYFVGVDARGCETYAAGLGSAAVTASRAAQGIVMTCCDQPPVVLRRCDPSDPVFRAGAIALAMLGHAMWKVGLRRPALALVQRAAPRGAYEPERGEETVGLLKGPAEAGRKFVFYHCYGSAHSSVVTAAVHLGRLPVDRPPTVREIARLPWFDRARHRDIGFPVHVGDDESGVGVYVLGLGPSGSCARRFVREVVEAGGLADRVALVDCLPLANGLVRVGGFLSRRLGLVFPGRLMAAVGIRRNYWGFVSLACRTRLRDGGPACVVDARLRATP